MKRIMATALLLAGFSGLAQAATLSYSGSTTHTLSGFDLNATTGLSNGSVIYREKKVGDGLYLSGPASLTLTYLGKEAGDTNVFRMPNTTEIFRNTTTPVGQKATVAATSGLLNFNFLDLAYSWVIGAPIKNGEGEHREGERGFYNSIGIYMESMTSALVLFNDFGGDKDYDDMAVRVQVSPVPVPAALPLFATAIAGMGYVARRRKAKA